MDILSAERRPVRAIGPGGHARGSDGFEPTEGPDRSLLDDPDADVGFPDDDMWPPHFGAARLGIP